MPQEPFPIIEECSDNKIGQDIVSAGRCNLHTLPPVNITCFVYAYYPSITLSFWQSTTKQDPINYTEWNNIDGTRNKAVTITAVFTDVSYTCVASNIPGIGKPQQEASVTLGIPTREITTEDVVSTISTEPTDNRKIQMMSKSYIVRKKMQAP